jgi:hypothetical protein
MRKIAATFGITAVAVVVFSPLPTAAFGIRLGPFYFHLPLVGHHYYRHHLYMRTNPNETRARPNGVNAARTEQTEREARTETSFISGGGSDFETSATPGRPPAGSLVSFPGNRSPPRCGA